MRWGVSYYMIRVFFPFPQASFMTPTIPWQEAVPQPPNDCRRQAEYTTAALLDSGMGVFSVTQGGRTEFFEVFEIVHPSRKFYKDQSFWKEYKQESLSFHVVMSSRKVVQLAQVRHRASERNACLDCWIFCGSFLIAIVLRCLQATRSHLISLL
jgi:hypothetical protein